MVSVSSTDLGPPASDPGADMRWTPELPWLDPYPDQLLEEATPSEEGPEAKAIARETIELAYLVAIQHLPPRQRAILILRDALDWSARETADLLETSVAAVNSGLQQAQVTMRTLRPVGRAEASPTAPPTAEEQQLLRRFMAAFGRAEASELAAILREDARHTMPPAVVWFDGRDAIVALHAGGPFIASTFGDFRMVATSANRQPAAVANLWRRGKEEYRLQGFNLPRIEGGQSGALPVPTSSVQAGAGLLPLGRSSTVVAVLLADRTNLDGKPIPSAFSRPSRIVDSAPLASYGPAPYRCEWRHNNR